MVLSIIVDMLSHKVAALKEGYSHALKNLNICVLSFFVGSTQFLAYIDIYDNLISSIKRYNNEG